MDEIKVMKKAVLSFILIFMLSEISYAYIEESAIIKIMETKYEPYPAEAGRYFNLWIKVENVGINDAENVTCVLLPEYPFILDPNENAIRNIGRLPGLEEVILQYKLRVDPNAIKGWNEMKIKCQTKNSNAWVINKLNVYVDSKIPKFWIGSITSEPAKLFPDSEDNKISLEIQNVGTGDAELVTTELTLPKGITPSESYSNMVKLGTIKAGESKKANYYIDIDKNTKPGVYKAILIVRYKNSNNNENEYKNQTLSVNIVVKPIPLFKIEKTEIQPKKISPGSNAEVKFKIKNTGFKEAKSVSVKVYKQSDQPFEFDEKYDYIGNLKPNQTGEVSFRFSVDKGAKLKTYLFKVEIRYIVGDDVKVVEKQIPISVNDEEKNSNLSFLLVLIIFLAIFGVYYGWKKIK